MTEGSRSSGTVVPSPDVVTRTVGSETVLLHVAKSRVYGLNRTAARLWALLAEGRTPPEIQDVLATEYDVDRDRIQLEVEALIEDLLDEGLLVPAPEPPA